jgi:hypothetical protein
LGQHLKIRDLIIEDEDVGGKACRILVVSHRSVPSLIRAQRLAVRRPVL